MRTDRHRIASSSLRRYAPMILALFAGVVGSLVLFYLARDQEQARIRHEFEIRAISLAVALQTDMDRNLEHVESIGELFAASVDVERQEFGEFVREILKSHDDIQALEWIPRVRESERASYEEAARRDGLEGFQFTERKAQGQMIRTGRRAEYFPVYYVEPIRGNELALGFDLASDPVRLRALKKARDTATMVATERITPVQETVEQHGVLVFLPMYRGGATHGTVEERRENLIGYALGVFRIADMVEGALKDFPTTDIGIHLYDARASQGEGLLYASEHMASAVSGPTIGTERAERRRELLWQNRVDVPGRRWSLELSPTSESLSGQNRWQAWEILAGGLAFTVLFGAYILSRISRIDQMERFGSALSKSNQKLEGEIAELQAGKESAEARLRAVVENTPVIMFALDNDGKFTLSEGKGLEVLGQAPGQLVGKSIYDVFSDVPGILENTGVALAGGSCNVTTEVAGVTLEAHCEPLRDQDGEVVGVVGVARDVTEGKRLQEQLIQSQKMEAIGTLAGGIAHDFNNLLSAMLAYSQLGMARSSGDEQLTSYLQEIQKAADRASQLTRQLLAFSRRQIVQPRPLNLNELVLNLDKMLRRLIGADVELVVLLGQDLGLVEIDPGQIEQALMNMAVNSRDAMPEGGRLVIETMNIAITAEQAKKRSEVSPGEYVMLRISDTGAGMAEEVMSHAFDPFFTTKDVGKGTGLGLSTCYGIVSQNGGHIELESELGQGTTFRIYLPELKGASVSLPSGDDNGLVAQGHETILLVEDEPAVRGLVSKVLREQGYTVLEAANGHEALSIVDAQSAVNIDLVLTDLVMPLMGGRELAERLQDERPETKVLYTSGYAADTVGNFGVLEEGLNFLQKPFTVASIVRKVREVIEK